MPGAVCPFGRRLEHGAGPDFRAIYLDVRAKRERVEREREREREACVNTIYKRDVGLPASLKFIALIDALRSAESAKLWRFITRREILGSVGWEERMKERERERGRLMERGMGERDRRKVQEAESERELCIWLEERERKVQEAKSERERRKE